MYVCYPVLTGNRMDSMGYRIITRKFGRFLKFPRIVAAASFMTTILCRDAYFIADNSRSLCNVFVL